ncbi:hypothetical protein V3C99_003501, partial [Haemonchus contortus]
EQLVPPFTLMKRGQSDSVTVEDFILANLNDGDWIGIDPSLYAYENGEKLVRKLKSMGISVASIRGNLVDEFWDDRPPLQSKGPIILTPDEHGCPVKDKLTDLRKRIAQKKCDSIILSALDDIMWLLNIRGFDIKYNPLAYSYVLVTPSEVHLFMDKADDVVRKYLESEGVTLHPYANAYDFIAKWYEQQAGLNKHKPRIRDSAALVSFLMWLETELLEGRFYSEIEVASKIESMRAALDKYVGLSTFSISAAGDHAAKPHHHPEGEAGKRLVTADEVYLLDSGAHYRDGTTDVTRTVWISSKSPIPQDFIRNNTLVLKGHINLANTVFPQGLTGIRLDTLARHALWQVGLDYGHGTGHGVGHFLNVHEGPASFGHQTASYDSDAWIREGMILTIEPGYYAEGKWGTRIENCYEVVRANVPSGADFLGFRALTLVPIQTRIIDKSMLTADEINWLNSYHDRVLSIVGKFLENSGKTAELKWLQKQCS